MFGPLEVAPGDAPGSRAATEAAPIASALGLELPRMQVNESARQVTGSKHAQGVALGHAIYLDPARASAGTNESRTVLAHELVHHAQSKLTVTSETTRDDAETEARELAEHYVATGEMAAPQVGIDLSRPAADSDARDLPGVTAPMYLHLHAARFLGAVRARVREIEPTLPVGLTWHGYARFAQLFMASFAARVGDFDVQRSTTLPELTYPADPFAAIDEARIVLGFDKHGTAAHPGDPRYGKVGLREWSDAAGRAFALVVETSLRASVTRMAGRYLAVARRKGQNGGTEESPWSPVSSAELVQSHPMDALVTLALPAHGVIEIASTPWPKPGRAIFPSAGTHAITPDSTAKNHASVDIEPNTEVPTTLKNGLRVLDVATFEWQGATDPKLWNWIKVTEPGATAEEVAEALWGSGAGDKSIYAYGITAMPPYFGLPKLWARNMAGAAEHAPKADRNGGAQEIPHDNAIGLAGSSVADEVALVQAPKNEAAFAAVSMGELGELVQQSQIQLAHIEPILALWGEQGILDSARAFLVDKQQRVAADPYASATWGPVLRQQQRVLYEVATQIDQIHRQVGAQLAGHAGGQDGTLTVGKLQGKEEPQLAPYHQMIAMYARAAATSHLAETSRALLAAARDQQQMLVARVATDAARTAEVLVDDMRGVTKSGDVERGELTTQAGELVDNATRLHSSMLDGHAPDTSEVDELLVTADEVSLKARVRALGEKLAVLESAAAKANDGTMKKAANIFHTEFWGLSARSGTLKAKLATIRAHLDRSTANARLLALGEPNQAALLREGRRSALAAARQELQSLQQDTNIEQFLQQAHDEVQDAQLRAVILQIGVLIGISLVSSGLGNAATAGARGFLAARSAQTVAATVELSRTAQLATRFGGLVLESGINAGGQTLVMGKPMGRAFVEDFATNLATSSMLDGLRSAEAISSIADDAVRGMWKAKAGKAVQLSGEMLLGAATSQVAGHLSDKAFGAEKPEPSAAQSWALQGASLAVGRFVSGAASKQLQRIQSLASNKGWQLGRVLGDKVRTLHADAVRLSSQPDYNASLELLRRRGELLHEEQALLVQIASDPVLAQRLGMTEESLGTSLRDNGDGFAELHGPRTRHVVLQGAGLRPAVGERIWTGDRAQVEGAIAGARKAGLTVETVSEGPHGVHLRFGSADVEVKLIGNTSSSEPGKRQTRPAEPTKAGPERDQAGRLPLPGAPSQAPASRAKQTLDDFIGIPANENEISGARSQAAREASMSLAEQSASIRTEQARSEREMLLAIKNGEMPRYIARVGPASSHATFANPNKPFVFATEPADLRGLAPAEAMWKVGWTREWIEPNIGKEIEVVILDTHNSITDPSDSSCAARVDVGGMVWEHLASAALSDRKFMRAAESVGITQQELIELFEHASGAPISESVARVGPARAGKMKEVTKLLEQHFSVNNLYTGIGSTMNESRQLGAREVMVRPNGTGLRLTPENHQKVSLGTLTQADFDALFDPRQFVQ
ncbi:MAG: eCIS core domain-containing protein [Kofleriaceae bacterium]